MILKLAFPKSKSLQGQTKQVNVITGLGDSVAHKQEGVSLKPIQWIEQTKSPFAPALLSLSFQSGQAQNNYEQYEPLDVMPPSNPKHTYWVSLRIYSYKTHLQTWLERDIVEWQRLDLTTVRSKFQTTNHVDTTPQ